MDGAKFGGDHWMDGGGISAVGSGRRAFWGVYQTRCVWLISGVAPRHRYRTDADTRMDTYGRLRGPVN